MTLFGDSEEHPPKQNGPIHSEKLFSELFTPPAARRQTRTSRKIDDDSDESDQPPTAPPRRFQTDRPDITDKITVSLSYYHQNENEKPKILI